jgi:hypothetical protein
MGAKRIELAQIEPEQNNNPVIEDIFQQGKAICPHHLRIFPRTTTENPCAS